MACMHGLLLIMDEGTYGGTEPSLVSDQISVVIGR